MNKNTHTPVNTPVPLKRIRLSHAYNVRDLGGLVTKENKIIRWNKLYWADSLTMLDATEWKTLQDRGICAVIDLRSTSEATHHPDHVPEEIQLFHCPIQTEQLDLKEFTESALRAFTESLKDGYGDMLTSHPELVVCCLKTLIRELKNGAVLFHCSAGKDRTGIVAATLLKLLGADDEDIIANYQVSHTFNQQGINRIARQMPQFEKIEPLLCSDPENMERLLKVFHEIDLRKFLISHGMTEAELAALKSLMLD